MFIHNILYFQVEEIDDIECNTSDPFYADAIANEKEIDLSEEQKKNFKKVCSTKLHRIYCFRLFMHLIFKIFCFINIVAVFVKF